MTLATLEPTEPATAPVHVMEVCTPRRKETVTWSPVSSRSIDAAGEVFRLRIQQGYLAYTVGAGDERQQIDTFDPTATRIVLHHAIAGG